VPKYHYTGDVPRVLNELIEGVNAQHLPADGSESLLVYGQTVVVEPGDSVDTGDLLYPAYQLEDTATGNVSVTPDETPELVAAPEVVPAPDAAPAPEAPAPAPAPTF
jgi:hypothetical protein